MKPIYVPILKAKKGEFDALAHLSERAINQIVPWFDVPRLDENARKKSELHLEPPVESFLNKTALGIAKVWASKPIFIDLPRWATHAQTESGEHVIPYLRNRLELLGIIVNPVVEYASWDDPVYVNALKGIILDDGRNFCIRLNMDVDTVEDMSDPDYFIERLSDIVKQLNINPANTYLLIDFGDVSSQAHFIEGMVDKAKQTISLVRKSGFSQFILAGSSLPTSIDKAVKARNTTGLVLRKEMITWRTLLSEKQSLNITFADYGVRNPSASDESMPFPNANGKIRYTIGEQYVIARGNSLNLGSGYGQFNYLAQTVSTSEYYLGSKFSWGDERISYYSKPDSKGSGNQTTWIAIDTNHHIETVLMEVLEFSLQLTAKKARSQD
jgi:hypothetical protein